MQAHQLEDIHIGFFHSPIGLHLENPKHWEVVNRKNGGQKGTQLCKAYQLEDIHIGLFHSHIGLHLEDP